MKPSNVLLLPLGLLLLVVCGCGRQDKATAVDTDVEQDIEIECNFFYRTSTRTSEGETKQFTIKVPFLQGDIPEISLGISEKVVFKDLSCSVGAEYNSLVVHFFDPKNQITTILYQFADKPVNRLAGGHGSTGLHYIYHPESEAELQFWAVVKEPDPKDTK